MRLWEDGFDHYGSDENNMLDGSYAEVKTSEVALSTTHPATGTHGVFLFDRQSGVNPPLRKVLPAAKDKMGAIARFYFPVLPLVNSRATIFAFQTSTAARSQVRAVVDSNGCIRFYRGTYFDEAFWDAGTLIATSDPIIVASAQNHIEVQVYIHDTLGWVRVAVNGVHRFEATGLDTKYDTSQIVSVAQATGAGDNGEIADFYMDDYQLYDFTGTAATDTDWCPTVDGSGVGTNYIGELQCMLCLATADTAEADWAKSTGATGYNLIGKATPADSTYIYSGTATDLSEFTLTDLPAEITYIRGLGFHSRLSKSDAGAAMYKVGMKSVASTTDATEIPMTVEPTYWHAQINVDPDSTTRWTRPSFNAAWLRQLRSA